MNWKEQLRALELHKEWDFAIELMQKVIAENPNDMDAYIYMNYLLMNLLVEEDYDRNKHDYYKKLTKKYFDESYAKFSNSAEYLFYTGITAVMSEWYFGIDTEDWETMLRKAMELEPKNPIYQRSYYIELDPKNPTQREQVYHYAKLILQEDSPIKKILNQKGAIGAYLYMITSEWAKDVVKEVEGE